MLNQLLKFTLVSSLLLWLRPRWRSLLALSALVILVHVLHGEYLGYVELSGNQSLLIWSYVLKWLVLVAGVVGYIFYVMSGPRSRPSGSPVGRSGMLPETGPDHCANDGFDFIRDKKQLQTRAEKIISQDRAER